MRLYIFVALFALLLLSWCSHQDRNTVDVNSIDDLSTLETMIIDLSENIIQWEIDFKQAQLFINQLQERYLELTDTTQQGIESQLVSIQKTLQQYAGVSYSLPLRAKKLGMKEPKDMELNTILSKHYSNEEGYDSTILVYKGEYDAALKQAEIIATNAGLHISKTFQQGQVIAKETEVNYISGLDVENLTQWIVYVNYDLLDTDIDTLLSVSVDKEWTLVLEATKYE